MMLKGPFRLIIKLFLFVAILLFVLEFVTRVFVPQQLIVYDDFYGPNTDGLGRFPRPQLDMIVNTGERNARLITDERGFRVGSKPQSYSPDKRVLLVGDSYLLAVQVDYEQTIGGLLEQKFAGNGVDVVFENSGSANFDLNHYKIIIEQLLGEASYDLAIVFLNHTNDLISRKLDHYEPTESRVRQLRLPSSLSRSELIDALVYPVNDWLERNSQLFMLIKSRAQTTLAQWGLTAFYFPWTLLKENADRVEWDVSAERMKEITSLGNEHDTPIVFVLVPTSHQIDTTWLDFYVEGFDIDRDDVALLQPNSRLVALAEGSVTLLDVHSSFEDAYKAGTRLYGQIDSHLSPEGNTLMADILYPITVSYLMRERIGGGNESEARTSTSQ